MSARWQVMLNIALLSMQQRSKRQRSKRQRSKRIGGAHPPQLALVRERVEDFRPLSF
jgi:hypothetical protein